MVSLNKFLKQLEVKIPLQSHSQVISDLSTTFHSITSICKGKRLKERCLLPIHLCDLVQIKKGLHNANLFDIKCTKQEKDIKSFFLERMGLYPWRS